MPVRHYDVIVVGCGGMGSSVSYHLATRGLKVLTVERFGLNHEFGSSHGRTRIIRLAYFEDTRYVPLLRRAYELWNQLQTAAGEEILSITGGLMIGPPEGELLTGALKSAESHAIPHRVLRGSEASKEFGAFRLEESLLVLYDPKAGIILPEKAISTYVKLAEEAGCEFRFAEPLVSWNEKGEAYEVHTSLAEYSADRIILCTGPWMGGLLKGLIPLQVERQVVFWFDTAKDVRFSAQEMPVFLMESGGGRYFYGIPDVGHGVKIARHHGGALTDPDTIVRQTSSDDEMPVKEFVAKTFPMLGAPIDVSVCMYSNTPDRNFVIDSYPGHEGVLMASACSGHGFKFASVLGEVAADLVTGRGPDFDISFLRARRFIDSSASNSGTSDK